MVLNEAFRVYHQNERLAISKFKNVCFKYMKTNNLNYQKYWNDIFNAISNGNYTIIKNTDFVGIRKI